MHLIYHPEAEWELIEAAKFYERRVPSLGGQFLNAADDAAAMILRAPHRWSVLEEDIRQYHMKRFPYAVYYPCFLITFGSSLSSIIAAIPITGVIA